MGKVILLLALVAVARAQFDWEPPKEYKRTPLGDNIDKASIKLLKTAFDSAKDKNVVSSPLSLMILLALYNNGAGPVSREEVTRFLGGSDYKQSSDSFKELSEEFAKMSPDYLTLANKVYVSDRFQLDDKFAEVARSYRSDFDTIDFLKNKEASDIINAWSSNKTAGNIKSPTSPDDFTPDTVLALLNVIYFRGHWHVPFKAADTKDEDFHVSRSQVVKKPMMNLEQTLYYHESADLGARLVELPYKESGFRMVIVLPNEIDGLPSVLAKASEKGLLNDVFKLTPASSDIILKLPKFEVKSKLDFNELLPKLGVSRIFDEPANGIAKGTTVTVSKAFQEAFIKVDEEGATAGAFTALVGVVGASLHYVPPKPIQFIVDRPFLYSILYEDKILFSALVTLDAASLHYVPPKPIQFIVDRPFLYSILYEDRILFSALLPVYGASLNYVPPEKIRFIVDRPFLYTILYEDRILFSGFSVFMPSPSLKPPRRIHYTVDRPFQYLILHEDNVLFTGTYTQ